MATIRFENGEYIATVQNEIWIYDVEDAIATIREAAKGLANAHIDGYGWTDRDRNQNGFELWVEGERPATEQEIDIFKAKEAEARANAQREAEHRAAITAQQDRQALERARRAYPDLFKPEV